MARTLTIEIDLDRLNRYSGSTSENEALSATLSHIVRRLGSGGPHVAWFGGANVGRTRIDLDAVSPCATVQIANPDDPFGPPAYDGPADAVGNYLAPGDYEGYDGQTDVRVTVDLDGHTTVARNIR